MWARSVLHPCTLFHRRYPPVKVIRLVDSIFKREGLSLRLRPYSILCCGEMKGLVECVTDAKSIDHIKKFTAKSGGIRVRRCSRHEHLPYTTDYGIDTYCCCYFHCISSGFCSVQRPFNIRIGPTDADEFHGHRATTRKLCTYRLPSCCCCAAIPLGMTMERTNACVFLSFFFSFFLPLLKWQKTPVFTLYRKVAG